MLKMLRLISLVLVCMASSVVAEEVLYSSSEKVYVDLHDLVFDSSGIFFKGATSPVQMGLKTLRFDSRGYYYHSNADETWICPNCNTTNPGKYNGQRCRHCGWPVED